MVLRVFRVGDVIVFVAWDSVALLCLLDQCKEKKGGRQVQVLKERVQVLCCVVGDDDGEVRVSFFFCLRGLRFVRFVPGECGVWREKRVRERE